MLLAEKLQTRRQGRLFEFSLQLQPGEIGLLLGRSGSGKSTLLEMLAGFLPISGGTLLADGQNIAALPPAQRPFTMLFHAAKQRAPGQSWRANSGQGGLTRHLLFSSGTKQQPWSVTTDQVRY